MNLRKDSISCWHNRSYIKTFRRLNSIHLCRYFNPRRSLPAILLDWRKKRILASKWEYYILLTKFRKLRVGACRQKPTREGRHWPLLAIATFLAVSYGTRAAYTGIPMLSLRSLAALALRATRCTVDQIAT